MKKCKVKDCNNKYHCKEYCAKHYQQILEYGKILKRTIKDKNKFIDCGDYYEIVLYKYKPHAKEFARAKIDKDDLNKAKSYMYCLDSKGYVLVSPRNKFSRLHQLILGNKKGFIIDHINHDPLDNRKKNLRHCTRSQNLMNTKRKGYYFNKPLKKWTVQITINNKITHIGNFKNEKDAIKTRHEAEVKYFGEFANKSN